MLTRKQQILIQTLICTIQPGLRTFVSFLLGNYRPKDKSLQTPRTSLHIPDSG